MAGHDWVVLAVSDGARSASRAAEGSKLAISLVRGYVERRPPVNSATGQGQVRTPSQWIRQLVERVGREWVSATAKKGRVEDFYATLAVVLITDVAIEMASIGDSFVLGLGCTGKVELLMEPDRPGGLTGSATYMLPDWRDQARYLTVLDAQARAVMLSTDGLESFLDARVVRRQEQLLPIFVGTKKWLANVLEQMVAKGDPAAATVFGRVDVLARKGDDIGVALALRASS